MTDRLTRKIKKRPGLHTERGQALVLFAVGLAAFLGLTGLSIDVGQLVSTRTDLQKVADAAALAGAQDLADPTPQTDDAEEAAESYVTDNGGGASVVAFSQTTRPNDTITVTVQRGLEYTFLKAIGMEGATVSATATVTVSPVTGFDIDDKNVFGYPVWGGNGNGSRGCAFDICDGDQKIYRFNPQYCDSPDVTTGAPDCTTPNFKGYFHDGGSVEETNINPATWQTFSKGGQAIGQQPIAALHAKYVSGDPIILPVIAAANCTGGCNEIDFKIVGWVSLRLTVDPATTPAAFPLVGEVVDNDSVPFGRTDSSNNPPANFPTVWTYGLTE